MITYIKYISGYTDMTTQHKLYSKGEAFFYQYSL